VTAFALRRAVDAALAALLFWGAHAAYRAATGYVQNCDSAYSLVAAEKLLSEHTLDLSGCVPADPDTRRALYGYAPGHDLPYQFARHADPRRPAAPPRVYYGYPLGSTVLSLPFVANLGVRRGLSTLHPDGTANLAVEELLQLRIAARVAAATVVLFYVIARFFCSPAVAFLIAAGFAVGSPVYSTLARALWSHTWMVFCLSAAVVLLLGRRRVERPTWRTDLLYGTALGTALFWTLFVRAHGVFSAAAIGVYLLVHHRRTLLVTLGAGGAWAAALVALSLHYFGTPTTPSVYDAATIDGRDIPARLVWLMAAPSRGLLVFCPYVAAAGAILVAYRKHFPAAGLLLPLGLAAGGHTALFACYNGWHGGSSYGPRYFCDLLPWFVLAVALAGRAVADAPGPLASWKKLTPVALMVACFGWGVFVHWRGANAIPAWLWNARALAVGPEAAVEEWHHPQFLAGLTFTVRPDGTVEE